MNAVEQQARELAERCAKVVWEQHHTKTFLDSPSGAPIVRRATDIILHELNLVSLLEDKARLEKEVQQWKERYEHESRCHSITRSGSD